MGDIDDQHPGERRQPGAALLSHALVPVVYAAVIAVLYGPMLNMFFVSDDFYFLGIVAPAHGISVIFAPLAGRFVRPLVVLNVLPELSLHWSRTVGLSPGGAARAPRQWVVGVSRREPAQWARLLSFLAGLMFIVFSGHSEAVTWPAGIADPLVTVCVLSGLLCYLRALEPGASRGWIPAVFAAVLVATQAKELWVVFPGLLVAHTLAFGWPATEARRRAAVAFGGTTALVVAYLAMCHFVFGSVTGGYGGLGSSLHRDLFTSQARAFVLRSFMPASGRLGQSWLRGDDLIFWAAVLLVLGWFARGGRAGYPVHRSGRARRSRAGVAPDHLGQHLRERAVRVPGERICVRLRDAEHRGGVSPTLGDRRARVADHRVALGRARPRQRPLRASGELTRGIVESFGDEAAAHPATETPLIFILNLPDNIGGAYTFRTGFYSAIKLVRPDAGSRTGLTFGVATQSVGTLQDHARVTTSGPRRFAIDLGSNRVVQPQIPSTGQYRIVSQSPDSYEVEFTDSIDTALVLYLNAGRLVEAGTARGPGLPFGSLDLPAEGLSAGVNRCGSQVGRSTTPPSVG